MTSSAAAAIKQALGAYGEALAARHLVEQGMVLLDRNWRCDAGEIDLVLRDGDVLVVCEVKTRSSLRYGTPHEAVTDIKVARLRRLASRWLEERGRRRARRPDRPGRLVRPRARRLGRRPRAGDRLMPFATAHTVSLHGAVGHLIDVQTDVSPGRSASRWSAGPTPRSTRPATAAGWRSSTAGLDWPATRRITILLSPADLLKRGTHFDLAVAVSVARGRRRRPGSRPSTATAFVGELTLDGNLRSVPGVLPMVLAAAERGVRRVFVPEPQAARGGDGARHERPRGAFAGPGRRRAARRRGPRGAPGGAMSGVAPAGLARAGAARGARPRRPARHGRRAVRRRGRRRRGPPPAAVRPEGRGQDQPRRADPGHPAGPHAGGVPGAERDPLAGRHPRPERRDARAAAVLRAPPRREQGQPDRRRQSGRSGPGRSAGPTAACCSSTSSRCSAPT